jgi:hypothetical protein
MANAREAHGPVCEARAAATDGPRPAQRVDRGDGIVALVHVGVAAALLSAATGLDFDLAVLVAQVNAYLETLDERLGAGDQWGHQGELGAAQDTYEGALVTDPWARSFAGFCEYPGYKRVIDAALEISEGNLGLEDAQLIAAVDGYALRPRADGGDARSSAAVRRANTPVLQPPRPFGRRCRPHARLTDCYMHLQQTTDVERHPHRLQDTEPEW